MSIFTKGTNWEAARFLEVASINNQQTQTLAALEAAKQAAKLADIAKNQRISADMATGAATPSRPVPY